MRRRKDFTFHLLIPIQINSTREAGDTKDTDSSKASKSGGGWGFTHFIRFLNLDYTTVELIIFLFHTVCRRQSVRGDGT